MPSLRVFLLLACAPFLSCSTSLFSTYDFADVSEARAVDQTSLEDSAKVFFATYPNPFTDREFLWFATFIEGPVELYVHNTLTDSVEQIYRFANQDIPVYTISLHPEQHRLVKCVLFVNGRRKCAKLYPAWYPIAPLGLKTHYTIEQK
jgi:hypothetical protein